MPIALTHTRRPSAARGRARFAVVTVLAGSIWSAGVAQAARAEERPVVKAAAAATVDTSPASGPSRVESAVSAGGIAVPTTVPGKVRNAVVAGLPTAADIVNNPRISLSERAKADLLEGGVDRRLLAVLQRVAKTHTISVTVLRSGHSQFVKGTDRVSNHIVGRAADIGRVDGQPVSESNTAALDVLAQALALPESIRPTELGGPIDIDGDGPIGFTDSGHDDHVHIGFDV